jgi:hypothetical protein
MARRSKAKPTEDPVAGELGANKRLLMLQLMRSGVKPIDIARGLSVPKSTFSAMIPARKLSFLKQKSSSSD